MDKSRVGNTEIRVFEYIVRALIILLPFTTLLSVFTSQKLGIPGFTYYKELLLIIAIGWIGWKHIKGQLELRWGWIDILLMIYVAYLVLISLGTTGIRGIIYGGRYDFEFFMMFWVMYHGGDLLEKPLSYYLKLFLGSTGLMLFVSGLLKFPLSEDLLLYFGYSGNPSAWQFGSVPPIFHGIDGANVRRFQGVLDGPNTMGAFLIMFSGIFAYYVRVKKNWFFVNGLVLFVLIIMIFYTYSRSAILGIIAAYGVVILSGIGFLFRHYRKQFLAITVGSLLVFGIIFIQYSGTFIAIVGRAGSTKGHLERMKTSITRFVEHPFGQGLGSSGPAYRHTQYLEGLDRTTIEEKDRFYIPESWYLQQLVEGGISSGFAFLLIMFMIFWQLFQKHPILGGMFVGVGVMNLFLHTFESAPFSLLFFLLIGLFLSKRSHGNHVYER